MSIMSGATGSTTVVYILLLLLVVKILVLVLLPVAPLMHCGDCSKKIVSTDSTCEERNFSTKFQLYIWTEFPLRTPCAQQLSETQPNNIARCSLRAQSSNTHARCSLLPDVFCCERYMFQAQWSVIYQEEAIQMHS
jgi:hypothetical protein